VPPEPPDKGTAQGNPQNTGGGLIHNDDNFIKNINHYRASPRMHHCRLNTDNHIYSTKIQDSPGIDNDVAVFAFHPANMRFTAQAARKCPSSNVESGRGL
jgi:hypothetical protein